MTGTHDAPIPSWAARMARMTINGMPKSMPGMINPPIQGLPACPPVPLG